MLGFGHFQDLCLVMHNLMNFASLLQVLILLALFFMFLHFKNHRFLHTGSTPSLLPTFPIVQASTPHINPMSCPSCVSLDALPINHYNLPTSPELGSPTQASPDVLLASSVASV